MKLGWFLIGIASLVFGGYPPFNIWLVVIGVCLSIYGLKAGNKK